MKILIGYDGSECAEAALVDVKIAGLPAEAEALVLSAVDVVIPPKTDVEDLDDPFVNYAPHGVKLAKERARKGFEETKLLAVQGGKKVSEMFPVWTVTSEAQPETPHWSIILSSEQ